MKVARHVHHASAEMDANCPTRADLDSCNPRDKGGRWAADMPTFEPGTLSSSSGSGSNHMEADSSTDSDSTGVDPLDDQLSPEYAQFDPEPPKDEEKSRMAEDHLDAPHPQNRLGRIMSIIVHITRKGVQAIQQTHMSK